MSGRSDEAVIQSEPEAGSLRRSLSGFITGSMTFASVGVSAGLFSLFGFALAGSGPAFFWGWLVIGAIVFFLCLMWAELSSHYPYAGSMYQWPAQLVGRRAGWWIGWVYLFAFAGVCMGTYLVLPVSIIPLFGLQATTLTSVTIALIAAVTATVINSVNTRFLGRFTEYGIFVEIGILVLLSLAVLIFGHHNSASILVNTNGNGHSFGSWLPDFLGFGAFVSIWVLFTFECAGTLGEETIDAKRSAPRAVMGSYFVTMALGVVFLFCFLLAIPNVGKIAGSATPLPDIINSALPHWFSKVYLILIAWVTILAGNIEFTAVVRQVYGMARDDQLPASKYLSRTRANGTPWIATIVVGCLTALPLIESTQLSVVLVGATAAMYSVYFSVSCILLWKRLRGWPQVSAPFKLGKWGPIANVAACIGAGAILLNLVWSRPDTNPTWKLGIPVCYWVMGIPIVLGAIYYVLVQHRRLGAQTERPARSAAES